MREILFKGKTPFTGTIGSDKWIESKSIRMQCNYVYLFFENKWINVNTDTLGQYTGLIDEYGKKIFEGDIIKWVDSDWYVRIDEVKFIKGHFFICNYNYTLDRYSNITIIGNIHDNPELLKGE